MTAHPAPTAPPAQNPRIGWKLGALIQLAAGIVVLVVLLGLCEFVAGRVVDTKARFARAAALLEETSKAGDVVATTIRTLQTFPAVNPSPLVPDVLLLWRNQAGARKTQPINPRRYGRNESWTVENDSRGYRGPELQLPTDDRGVFRVVCVGDSITFGFNVDQPDAYPRQLERLLRARHPGRRIEVVNTGVPGWSWLQGLRFLQIEGFALHPDLVVAAHGTNDRFFATRVTDAERLRWVANPLGRAVLRAEARLTETNTYQLLATWSPPHVDRTAESAGCREQMRRGGVCKRLSLDDIDATVGELAARTKAAGARLLLLNLDFIETGAVEGSRAAATRAGLPLLDFDARFAELRAADENARADSLGLARAADEPRPSHPARHHVTLRVAFDGTPPAPLAVRGNYSPGKPEYDFDVPLRDDGAAGDERAHDGVYSATFDAPPGASRFEYKYFAGDVAELESLPPTPSSMGNRVAVVRGDHVGPVDVFGRLFMMAERTHPDRDGQAVVATGIADWIDGDADLRGRLAR